MYRNVLALALLLSLSTIPATARDVDADQLALVERVAVNRAFSFEGSAAACEPLQDSIVSEVELVLRRSGIEVVDSADYSAFYTEAMFRLQDPQEIAALYRHRPHTLTIMFTGLHLEPVDTCVIAYTMTLARVEALLLDAASGVVSGSVLAFQDGGVLTWPRPEISDQLRANANRITVAVANEVLKARGR